MPVNVLTVLVGRIGTRFLGLCFSISQAKVYLGFRLRKEGLVQVVQTGLEFKLVTP